MLGNHMMPDLTKTTTTLLEGLFDQQNTQAWLVFNNRFFPMIVAYARRRGIQEADAEDIAQETLIDFAKAYRDGKYDRERGRLRHWLGGIASHRISKHLARRGRGPHVITGEGKSAILHGAVGGDQGPDQWEQEWERHMLELCKAQIRAEFSERVYEAFEQYAVNGRPADEVAEEFRITRNTLYISKSRILTRMREIRSMLEDE